MPPTASDLLLQFVDPANINTVRLDLSSNSSGLRVNRNFRIGGARIEFEGLHQQPHDGMDQAGAFYPEDEQIIPIRVSKQASVDAILALWGALTVELRRPSNALKYRIPFATNAFVYDTYQSPVPDLPEIGQWPWWVMLETVDPVPVSVWRDPFPR